MKKISKTIAQYKGLWEDAVVCTGKKDCLPSLVLLDNINYYDKVILNPNTSYKINTSIYYSLEAPKEWKRLTLEEKIYFYADCLYHTAIKAPYILPHPPNLDYFINTSAKSGYFGDFIIKAIDENGNITPNRSLVSFDCIAFTLLLDIKKLYNIQKYKTLHPNKRADYIRRNIFARPIKKLEQEFNHDIPYMFVVEETKKGSDLIHIHGMLKIKQEDFSLYDTKRHRIENILLRAALGKNYKKHKIVNIALKIVLPYHPFGWVSYICKRTPSRGDVYISKRLQKEGKDLYNEYRETVKAALKRTKS